MPSTAPPPPRGMPILSGPPPIVESPACRQCGRDFNPLWRRAKSCSHCGYSYCPPCLSDGQALMPRRVNDQQPTSMFDEIRDAFRAPQQSASGYDVESVCLHCLGMLQVTAAPNTLLRSLPLKRLKEYLKAYNIPITNMKEKEDLVQAVIKARNPRTGCLTPEHEAFYRRRSVPRQGQMPDATGNANGNQRRQPSGAGAGANYRPPPPPNFTNNPRPPNARPPPPRAQPQAQGRPPPPQAARPAARPTPAPAPKPVPKAPIPTLRSLVPLPKSYLNELSIGTLKAILYDNHVRVDFKQVLEKAELVGRVSELVADERKRMERQRLEEERLERAAAATAAGDTAAAEAIPKPSTPEGMDVDSGSGGEGSGAEPKVPRVPTGPPPDEDRGLCVVCQDEEATLAVVDCGHLSLCAQCSEFILATSKECPLCRTRIVTSQRLIRIYRT